MSVFAGPAGCSNEYIEVDIKQLGVGKSYSRDHVAILGNTTRVRS
jgi:hypothetical protein